MRKSCQQCKIVKQTVTSRSNNQVLCNDCFQKSSASTLTSGEGSQVESTQAMAVNSPDSQILGAIMDMESRLSSRMESLERRLSEKFKSFVEAEISTFKLELEQQVGELKERISILETARQDPTPTKVNFENDLSRSLVVLNFPESNADGSTSERLNSLINEHLNLPEVVIKNARRIRPKGDKPGVVFVETCSKKDRDLILQNKSKLKNISGLENVFIQQQRPKHERVTYANMKEIIKALGKDKLSMKGNRVVRSGPSDANQGLAQARPENRLFSQNGSDKQQRTLPVRSSRNLNDSSEN